MARGRVTLELELKEYNLLKEALQQYEYRVQGLKNKNEDHYGEYQKWSVKLEQVLKLKEDII